MIAKTMLSAKNLKKTFILKGESITVLNGITLEIPSGTFCSITGPSGSGKSTLLTLLAGLEQPSEGSVMMTWQGQEYLFTSMSEEQLCHLRAKSMGFVFQNFRLLPTLTALENVAIPLEILGQKDSEDRALEMLDRVGLKSRAHHLPSQLSGGEQQRVAVARAFVSKPPLLFADEPTGNLDSKNGVRVLELLLELKNENRSTLVIVTHDLELAAKAERQFKIRDGVLV